MLDAWQILAIGVAAFLGFTGVGLFFWLIAKASRGS